MAVDMFLKLTDIKGESKDQKHPDEIQILAWSWAMSNSGNAHMGQGAGAGKSSFQDVHVTKWTDLATVPIIQAVSTGKHVTEATLVVRKAGEKPLEYLTLGLKEVFITSWTGGGSGGEDRLTENISLNFAKFKVQYKEQTATGAAGTAPDFSYDIPGAGAT